MWIVWREVSEARWRVGLEMNVRREESFVKMEGELRRNGINCPSAWTPNKFQAGDLRGTFWCVSECPTRGVINVLEDLPRLKEVTDLSGFGFHLTINS